MTCLGRQPGFLDRMPHLWRAGGGFFSPTLLTVSLMKYSSMVIYRPMSSAWCSSVGEFIEESVWGLLVL